MTDNNIEAIKCIFKLLDKNSNNVVIKSIMASSYQKMILPCLLLMIMDTIKPIREPMVKLSAAPVILYHGIKIKYRIILGTLVARPIIKTSL
jgi:hypothetical protein